MRFGLLTAFSLAAALGGCATAAHEGMNHGAMNHEEMMRHCQMMEQHQAQGGHDAAEHDPAQHGGMSHEEMMRHCAEMRAQHPGEDASASHPH